MGEYKKYQSIHTCLEKPKGDWCIYHKDKPVEERITIHKFKPQRSNKCASCGGTNFTVKVEIFNPSAICTECDGTGMVEDVFSFDGGKSTCPKCQGKGKIKK